MVVVFNLQDGGFNAVDMLLMALVMGVLCSLTAAVLSRDLAACGWVAAGGAAGGVLDYMIDWWRHRMYVYPLSRRKKAPPEAACKKVPPSANN